jgi:hypothetical protein
MQGVALAHQKVPLGWSLVRRNRSATTVGFKRMDYLFLQVTQPSYLLCASTPNAIAISARFSQAFDNASPPAPIIDGCRMPIMITAKIKANTE